MSEMLHRIAMYVLIERALELRNQTGMPVGEPLERALAVTYTKPMGSRPCGLRRARPLLVARRVILFDVARTVMCIGWSDFVQPQACIAPTRFCNYSRSSCSDL